jgi:hypothetical protein
LNKDSSNLTEQLSPEAKTTGDVPTPVKPLRLSEEIAEAFA